MLQSTPACVQNVDGATEAGGFCRDEFQAFCKYFANPLIQLKLRERYDEKSDELVTATQTFNDVVDDWRAKLQGAYDCMLPGSTKVKDVRGAWKGYKNVPRSAYKPTTAEDQMPFFVTIDRSTAQNFWVQNKKKHLAEPGIPLLQIIKMPPRGHDLHQIVEHAIGAMKSHVYRVLGEARQKGKQLTTALAVRAVQEGIKLFTAKSWDANLLRLLECLQIVAAPFGEIVRFERRDENEEIFHIEVRGTGGGYCPPGWS